MAITIPILTDFKGQGIDRGIAQFQKLEGAGAKAGFLIQKAALPAAAAIGALSAGAVVAAKAAAEDAAAQDKLAGTLRRVTGASDAAVTSTEDYISKLSQSVGVADDELRPALGKLATATGDLTKAQELLGISLDVAAQTGKPLESVTTALSKAYGGNFGALNRLLPGFDQGIIKSKDFAKAQEELARLTGGAAAQNADTAAGQFRKFQITLEETKESIGAALLPIFEAFLPVLQRAAQWVQENTKVVMVLTGVVGGLAGAVLAANAAMKLYTVAAGVARAAQLALNVVMAANPIGLLVTALAALVAGIILAYNNSETFRDIMNAVFSAVSKVVDFLKPIGAAAFDGLKLAFNAVKTVIENLAPIFTGVFDAAKTVYDFLRPIVAGAFNGIQKAFELLEEPLKLVRTVFNAIDNVAGPVIEVLKKVGSAAFAGLAAAFKALALPIEAVADALQAAKTLWEWFKKQVEGEGGNPFRPGGSLAGPIGTGTRPITGGRRSASFEFAGGGGMAAPTYVINIDAGLVSTPDQVGQQIIEAVQRAQRRSGPAFVSA